MAYYELQRLCSASEWSEAVDIFQRKPPRHVRYAVLSPLCATLREHIELLLTPSPLLADAGVLETTTDERALKLLRLAQELGAI